MRTLLMLAGSLLVIMVMGLTSCDKDELSTEQQAYINQNKEYIWEKKAQKGEDGKLVYQQVIVSGDTALFRVIKKENDWSSFPLMSSTVSIKDMEGKLINGRIFQPKSDATLRMNALIPGFSAILLCVHPDETVEMIIPAGLGYLYTDYNNIPGGSTLLFTLTLDKIQ